MPRYQAVSPTNHADKAWKPLTHYQFVAQSQAVPVLIDEMSHVIPTLPLAFRFVGKQNDTTPRWELVALTSPVPERNLFVKPDGQWLAGYVPAWVRMHPFRILRNEQDEAVVCVDSESDLICAAQQEGSQPFYQDGQSTPPFQQMIDFLTHYEQRRLITQQAADLLARQQLIVPWQFTLKHQDGKETKAAGMFKIDAKALAERSAEQLYELHPAGALAIAHAQLLSEQRVGHFGRLLAMQDQHTKAKDLDIEALFGGKDDILKFN